MLHLRSFMASTAPRGTFSNANRHMQEEETLQLTSVGVDIGSSTSHLVFSRLELTLEGSRYRVTKREILNESDILLTPYVDDTRIDVEALEAFINQQYKKAKIRREEVDTGALILTGVAVRRRNARAIGELFAQEAGKFVAVSAGDGLEATMAAHGSGAVAHSGSIGHRHRRALDRVWQRRRRRPHRRGRSQTCRLGRLFSRAGSKDTGKETARDELWNDRQVVRYAKTGNPRRK